MYLREGGEGQRTTARGLKGRRKKEKKKEEKKREFVTYLSRLCFEHV